MEAAIALPVPALEAQAQALALGPEAAPIPLPMEAMNQTNPQAQMAAHSEVPFEIGSKEDTMTGIRLLHMSS